MTAGFSAWVGKLPEDWRCDWLKWSVQLSAERPSEEEQEKLPYLANEDIESWTGRLLKDDPKPAESDGRKFSVDDVLFNKLRPYLAKVYHAQFDGVSSGELLCLRPSDRVLPKYLFYVLVSKGFIDTVDAETFGSKMPRADWDIVGHQPLPLPPLETQQRIARFLDEKTARIDALIAKKRALLERLAEKRQALITRAVTKGLNPDASMKPSGIDWLGEIPAHWSVRGLTKCTTRVDYRGATPEKASAGIFLVTAKNIKNGRIDYEISQEYVPEDVYEQAMRRGLPKLGEVLFTTEAPLGEIAQVDREDIALAQRVIKFTTSTPELENDYLAYWMMSTPFQAQIQSRATGSTALGLKASKIVDLPCLLPLKDEQVEIVARIGRGLTQIDKIEAAIRKSLEFKIEYRSALITAAVTGKIAELH
jgi:type I restriction enzyme S subunit